jgi:hypothetical protein
MNVNISFKNLFQYCLDIGFEKIVMHTGNEVIKVNNISVLAYTEYVNVIAISRHLVNKVKHRITVRCTIDNSIHFIETTNDHTCIRIDDSFCFENVKASKIEPFDYLPMNLYGKDCIGIVLGVDELDNWNEYVYDLEVEDDLHCYYANNILVHNSQFINITPMVDNYIKNHNLAVKDVSGFSKEQLDGLVAELDDFIENDVNVYIKDHINSECHTTQGHNLHYSREYVAAQGMFFKKKNYITHIIKQDDKHVDKFKYCGVSCKKTEIPVGMKSFLKNIFEDTCTKNWNEVDYRKYIDSVFSEFSQTKYEDIALYKTYNTEKASIGFMASEKGTGAHARAANIHNQLLTDLHIADKYEKIKPGDQLRYCYVNDSNPYGINIIAFKDNMPEEFKNIFSINYDLMFEKIFLSSLKGYIGVMKFNEYIPSNKSICDITDL